MGPGTGQVISARGAPGEGAWSGINIAAQIDLGADNQRGCLLTPGNRDHYDDIMTQES